MQGGDEWEERPFPHLFSFVFGLNVSYGLRVDGTLSKGYGRVSDRMLIMLLKIIGFIDIATFVDITELVMLMTQALERKPAEKKQRTSSRQKLA